MKCPLIIYTPQITVTTLSSFFKEQPFILMSFIPYTAAPKNSEDEEFGINEGKLNGSSKTENEIQHLCKFETVCVIIKNE